MQLAMGQPDRGSVGVRGQGRGGGGVSVRGQERGGVDIGVCGRELGGVDATTLRPWAEARCCWC